TVAASVQGPSQAALSGQRRRDRRLGRRRGSAGAQQARQALPAPAGRGRAPERAVRRRRNALRGEAPEVPAPARLRALNGGRPLSTLAFEAPLAALRFVLGSSRSSATHRILRPRA